MIKCARNDETKRRGEREGKARDEEGKEEKEAETEKK